MTERNRRCRLGLVSRHFLLEMTALLVGAQNQACVRTKTACMFSTKPAYSTSNPPFLCRDSGSSRYECRRQLTFAALAAEEQMLETYRSSRSCRSLPLLRRSWTRNILPSDHEPVACLRSRGRCRDCWLLLNLGARIGRLGESQNFFPVIWLGVETQRLAQRNPIWRHGSKLGIR